LLLGEVDSVRQRQGSGPTGSSLAERAAGGIEGLGRTQLLRERTWGEYGDAQHAAREAMTEPHGSLGWRDDRSRYS
jgi:hypothetical protein